MRGVRVTVLAAGISRAGLTRVMEQTAPHIRALLVAVRDLRVGFMFVPQDDTPFRIPKNADRPTIVPLGDDFETAQGPGAFHMPSVRRIIRAAAGFAVISSAPPVEVYAMMAANAAKTRKSCLLIETRPEQEIQWVHLIQKLAPGRPICLATVKGGSA